ncbi:MAG: hypothetical protein WBO10_12555 [Pyrinomonadaceae bacterium]
MANEPQTTQAPAESEPTVPQNAETQAQVTDAKATIKIEGQGFELDAALAQDDKTLRVVLQPHFASIENANITREVKDGKLTVTIVKKAQHKGCR